MRGRPVIPDDSESMEERLSPASFAGILMARAIRWQAASNAVAHACSHKGARARGGIASTVHSREGTRAGNLRHMGTDLDTRFLAGEPVKNCHLSFATLANHRNWRLPRAIIDHPHLFSILVRLLEPIDYTRNAELSYLGGSSFGLLRGVGLEEIIHIGWDQENNWWRT